MKAAVDSMMFSALLAAFCSYMEIAEKLRLRVLFFGCSYSLLAKFLSERDMSSNGAFWSELSKDHCLPTACLIW